MENEELLIKLTKELMHDYFQGNPETWFQYLDPRCIFVATGETILSGIDNIKHELKAHLKKGRGNILSDEYFHIPLSKKVTVVIAYTISESKEENDLQIVNIISFIWQIKGKTPKIVYEHASYRFYDEKNKDTFSPLKVEASHFQIAKHLLMGNPKKKRICFLNGNKTIYLDTSMLLYIEGNRHTTLLHCIDNTYTCTQSLQQLREELPDDFYQIHRSYIIHVDYLISVYCYEAELIGGITIPIPANKYRQVKTDLEKITNKSLKKLKSK
ncbi:LytR/AlgR family response regulator transcription factor [Parablautia sp. Marseille-Q6255]|uniref:LytR/AlgR family response regulator transcription factor n=1 Tax=Parablautia sp. Marseille-Q6255 TaxID=3039593 RepID=UPI0024BCCA08|nr:LytTR family DNA-binding domain-containing protein [Parablautia sp. Marseille-Q6255]